MTFARRAVDLDHPTGVTWTPDAALSDPAGMHGWGQFDLDSPVGVGMR